MITTMNILYDTKHLDTWYYLVVDILKYFINQTWRFWRLDFFKVIVDIINFPEVEYLIFNE